MASDTNSSPRPPVVAIDASRNRSGGARAHLLGLLSARDPRDHDIGSVHLWTYAALAAAIPDAPWLVKHVPAELEGPLWRQLWWQRRRLPIAIRTCGCDILLSTDAGTICPSTPSIVMSRDMLCFEPGEMQRYRHFSMARLRLELLRHVQVAALRRATGALFLTQYAADTIGRFTGPLSTSRVVPHGVSEAFRGRVRPIFESAGRSIRCTYVSNADLYKHQWHVVAAIARLREEGHRLSLRLVGGRVGPGRHLLEQAIRTHDPDGSFVEVTDPVPHDRIPDLLMDSDLFIFASSCECMPNTLVEAMASGLPIACSDRGPMPEILQDAGTYFDPEDPQSISVAVKALFAPASAGAIMAQRAAALARRYSWSRCAAETWDYVHAVWAASNQARMTLHARRNALNA